MVFTLLKPYLVYIIATIVFVGGLTGVYFVGKSNGKQAVLEQVKQEREEWAKKIVDAQKDVDLQVAKVKAEYILKENTYQNQIKKLKNSQVITTYIPQTVNFKVPNGFVKLHDTAAKGTELSESDNISGSKRTLNTPWSWANFLR